MQAITVTELAQVTGGNGAWTPQDFQNIRPASATVTSQPTTGGFQTRTPMVSSQPWQPPADLWKQLGL